MQAFNVGDLVMYARRTQTHGAGMRVEEVDTNMFDTRIKVYGKWWSPEAFISYEEWKAQCQASAK